jgi:predicted HD phosphohydrolase
MAKAEVKKLVKFFAKQFQLYGGRRYAIDEPTSLFHHSVQVATLLHHTTNGNPEAVISGLLHDYGHVAKGLPIAPSSGIDDEHEYLGAKALQDMGFPASVTEPIRLHVLAKRYLYTVNVAYGLSRGSQLSLALQGGKLGELDLKEFKQNKYFSETLQLRQADDCGKDPHEEMVLFRSVSDFEPYFLHVLTNKPEKPNLPVLASPLRQQTFVKKSSQLTTKTDEKSPKLTVSV